MQNADVVINFALIHNANKSDAINLQQSYGWVFLIQVALRCLAEQTHWRFSELCIY